MSVNLYRSDGTTLLDGLAITGLEAGADSDVATIKVKNDGGTTALNVLLVMRTVSAAAPNVLLANGVPPQDEMWGRMRIVAGATTTDWRSVGAYSGLLIGDIEPDAVVTVEFKLHPPSLAESLGWSFVPAPIYNENSQPVPPSLTRVDRGILTGIGDYSHSGLIRGLGVTATGTPDDEVHSAAGQWVHNGTLYGDVARDWAFTDEDVAAAALASGESYIVIQSRGAGVTNNTKGAKGTTPTAPTMPAGDVYVDTITVQYQVGGTPVIETADLAGDTVHDRYLAADGGALDLTIHAGQAQGGSTWRYSHGPQTLPLTDATTNYVWQLASGLFDATTSATVAPEDTATGPWWKVVTAAGAISSITDWRTYAGQTEVLTFNAVALTGGTGLKASMRVAHERLTLETVMASVPTNGGGASGSTILDVHVRAATIYTDSGVDDQRPTFAFNAATLTDDGSVHQVTDLRRGDVIELYLDAEPVGGTPASATVMLVCRKP